MALTTSPEIVEAIGVLREKEILSPGASAALLRVARRELVSVRFELRALLCAGVLLVVSGVGVFLKQNQDRIGPVAIASLLGIAAAGCLLSAFRARPRLPWTAARGSPGRRGNPCLPAWRPPGSTSATGETASHFPGPACRYSRPAL